MEVGAEVVVTKGKHAGSRGIVERITAKKVKLDFVDTLILRSSVDTLEGVVEVQEPQDPNNVERDPIPDPVYDSQLLGHTFGHSYNVYGLKRVPARPNTFLICVSNASSCCQIWMYQAADSDNWLGEAFRFERDSIEVPYKRGTDVPEEDFADVVDFTPNGQACFTVAVDKASKTNQCWLYKFETAKWGSSNVQAGRQEREKWMCRHECEEGVRISGVKHAPTAPHVATTEVDTNGQHAIVIRDPRTLAVLARMTAGAGIVAGEITAPLSRAPLEDLEEDQPHPAFAVPNPSRRPAVEPKICGMGWLGTDVVCIVEKASAEGVSSAIEGCLLVWATKPAPTRDENPAASSWSRLMQTLNVVGSGSAHDGGAAAAADGTGKSVSTGKSRWLLAAKRAAAEAKAAKIATPHTVKVRGHILGRHSKMAVSNDGTSMATISEGSESRHQVGGLAATRCTHTSAATNQIRTSPDCAFRSFARLHLNPPTLKSYLLPGSHRV
jgi:hypothetical protein